MSSLERLTFNLCISMFAADPGMIDEQIFFL